SPIPNPQSPISNPQSQISNPQSPIPSWLGWLVLGAAVLRLAAGVLWFVALPQWGHGAEVEMSGYVMSDAYKRDTAAWELSQSDKPLWTAFQDYRLADQYGGLLFLSAGIYRHLGGAAHQPLMMVVLTAAFSALAVLFTWAFTRRLWGDAAARVAAWILALYPEAVLLGSSQMREAFTMTLAAAAFYGLVLVWQERTWTGGVWLLGALLLGIPLSPTFTALLAVTLVTLGVFLGHRRWGRDWRLWAALAGLICIGLTGIWIFGERLIPGGGANPAALLQQWVRLTAQWQTYTGGHSSGWMQKIFKLTPDWAHTLILSGYGVVQPFLPAAMIATGNWLWRAIALWRAIGWTFVLLFLMYAPMRAVRKRVWSSALGMSAVVWLVILTASLRSGGDQWDNPRYRASFVALQAALAAWAWVEQRREPDPWLRRVLVGMGFVFAWFIPWYVRRYIPQITWPVVDLFKTLGLGLASAVLYWIWDVVRSEIGD
ncbi:MAG: hypothetical protein KKD28_01635, partial [Chloroflexi bacterium]|nr:hypothetical protein [Chloroflexota bacterium]